MTQKAGPAGIPSLKRGSEKIYYETWQLHDKSAFLLKRVVLIRKFLRKFVFHLNPN